MAKAKTILPTTPEKVVLELDYDEARTLSALLYCGVGSSGRGTTGGVHWERLSTIGRAIRRAMGESWTFEHTDTLLSEFVFKTNNITDCVRDRVGNERLRQHMDCYSGGKECLVTNHLDCPMKP